MVALLDPCLPGDVVHAHRAEAALEQLRHGGLEDRRAGLLAAGSSAGPSLGGASASIGSRRRHQVGEQAEHGSDVPVLVASRPGEVEHLLGHAWSRAAADPRRDRCRAPGAGPSASWRCRTRPPRAARARAGPGSAASESRWRCGSGRRARRPRSTPPRSAIRTPSLNASICTARLMLMASLSSSAWPTSPPTNVTLLPSWSRIGSTRRNASDCPPAMIARLPLSAAGTLPGDRCGHHRGAARRDPLGKGAAGLRTHGAHVHVDRPGTVSPARMPSGPSVTARERLVVRDHADDNLALLRRRSRRVAPARPPALIRPSALALVRLVPRTTWPTPSRRSAIRPPIAPRPTTPISLIYNTIRLVSFICKASVPALTFGTSTRRRAGAAPPTGRSVPARAAAPRPPR